MYGKLFNSLSAIFPNIYLDKEINRDNNSAVKNSGSFSTLIQVSCLLEDVYYLGCLRDPSFAARFRFHIFSLIRVLNHVELSPKR